MSDDKPLTFTIDQILAMIPHRYPFLLVDRVIDAVADKSAVGIKAVTINDPYFRGLPQHQLVMPGVLIIEAMAQTAAVLVVHTLGSDASGKLVYFMGLNGVRFHRPVRPGDELRLKVSKVRSFGPTSKIRGEATVGDKLVAEAFMSAMIAN